MSIRKRFRCVSCGFDQRNAKETDWAENRRSVCPQCGSVDVAFEECRCLRDFFGCPIHKDEPAYSCGYHNLRHADGCPECEIEAGMEE